jgi:VWFA-related protein
VSQADPQIRIFPAAPVLGLLSLVSSGLAAQELDRSRPAALAPAFPVNANIVWIDVVAVDSKDRPFANLGPEDFDVVEGGERRPILLFRAPDLDEETPGAREQPERSDGLGPARRAVVFLVEDVLVRAQQIQRARDAVRRTLSRAAAGDRILLMAPASGVSAAALVPDDTLAAQLDRIRAHPELTSTLSEPGEIRRLYWGRVDAVVTALEALHGHAGPRAVIVVGPSLPYRVDGRFGSAAYERVMRASQRAASPIYFFKCGEATLSWPSPTLAPDWVRGTGAVGGIAPILPMTPGGSGEAGFDVFEAVAADSGGFTAGKPAAWAWAIDRIMRRSRAYYLLGIPSAPATWDGRYHRVDVRVTRKDVRLHTRTGYFAPAAPAPDKP